MLTARVLADIAAGRVVVDAEGVCTAPADGASWPAYAATVADVVARGWAVPAGEGAPVPGLLVLTGAGQVAVVVLGREFCSAGSWGFSPSAPLAIADRIV